MAEIINFTKAKADADRDRSALIATVHVYMNEDSSETWAAVENVDMQDIDAGWHQFMADRLRQLAWISDGHASEQNQEIGPPIASVNIFEDRRISTRWNDDLVSNAGQVKWIREQLDSGADEIADCIGESTQ